jgi:hypothetical protein
VAEVSVRPPSRLRIDFQVREITAEAGQEPRYVTFGDEVDMGKVREFFDRCGLGVDTMFQGYKTAKYIKQLVPAPNKINLIKLVREWTNLGLKDAKDVVELPTGRPMVLFREGADADAVVQICRRMGMPDVVSEPISEETFRELASQKVPEYIKPPSV